MKWSWAENGRKIRAKIASNDTGALDAPALDAPVIRNITATDNTGREILSYVPLPLVSDFLSTTGQMLISRLELFLLFSTLTNGPNDPQVTSAMTGSCSFHVNHLWGCGAMIFGPGFKQIWFPLKINRGSIEKFQMLLGAHMTPEGKKYPLLPPILFPTGSQNRKDMFLNPALAKASLCLFKHSLHSILIKSRYWRLSCLVLHHLWMTQLCILVPKPLGPNGKSLRAPLVLLLLQKF